MRRRTKRKKRTRTMKQTTITKRTRSKGNEENK